MDDSGLIRLLKIGRREARIDGRNQPDLGYVHAELKKKGVTLQLLWEEYKVSVPDGYQLSQFYGGKGDRFIFLKSFPPKLLDAENKSVRSQ